MATPDAQEAVISERIVKHMNADHADSVRRYLKAFKNKSITEVRDARLTGVSLNDLKFACGAQQVTIPLDPPMKAMREARERLIQLDKEALDLLGLTEIPITKYTAPYASGLHPIHPFNFTLCLIVLITFSRRANFKSGSLIHDNLLSFVPGFGEFLFTIQPYLFYIMLAIHATETVFMASKLRRHGLTPSARVWWAWMGSCFVEGKTCWVRLDAHINEKLKEREVKKH